jgi:bacillithiol biosynthesis deacetylase BshB1
MVGEVKLDILAFGAHPDDVELSAAGTLAKAKAGGKKIGIIDLTKGELGSRGSAETRAKEASVASEILQLDARENLEMKDGYFAITEENTNKVIQVLRKYKPEIILCNAPSDRHPDHGRAAKLVKEACFLSGLVKIETKSDGGELQDKWRPSAVYSYIQDHYLAPTFVVDISEYWEIKLQAIKAYASQFYNPDSQEPETPISSKGFMEFIEGRASQMGRNINAPKGEGFISNLPIGLNFWEI